MSDQEDLWSHRNKFKYSQFFANRKKENFALLKFWRRSHYTKYALNKTSLIESYVNHKPMSLKEKMSHNYQGGTDPFLPVDLLSFG